MKKLRVLIACEESQVVCKAFRERGHEAYSCDIIDTSGEHPEWHIKGDVLKVLNDNWDMMIAFPPCTYLTYAGTAHWHNPGRLEKRLKALSFFAELWLAPIGKICLENPKGCASPVIAKYTQVIQPYYFGDKEMKTTWLWLKSLPPLQHNKTNDLFNKITHTKRPEPYTLTGPTGKRRYFTDAKTRDPKIRSKTFQGIANAMAAQWS